MPVVAVAGGTASIGRAIVEAVVADGLWEVVVFSRKAEAGLEEILGVRIVAVDYSDVDSLVLQLQENNVHTLISSLSGRSPPENELSLISAAERSKTTERYIPSVWGFKYSRQLSWFPIAAAKLPYFEALDKTSLKWTVVSNGFFLDYWGGKNIKSYLSPMTLVLDLPARQAAIPGTGDKPVVFTYTGDVARFTAKLLTLQNWQPESYCIGDKVTWNEFVRFAEEVTGDKFDVTYDSLDVLESGRVTELPSHREVYEYIPKEALQDMLAQCGRLFEESAFDFRPEQSLNDIFPEIKPMSVKEMLRVAESG